MTHTDLYLQHHGVPGMRWGVRHDKKKSGSKRKMSQDAREANRIKKKHVSEMSNQELQKLNNRQQLEANYKRNNKRTIAKGMTYVGATAAAMGTLIALYNNSNQLINIGKKFSRSFNNDYDYLRRVGDHLGGIVS